jgi:hypothetical protein
MISYDDLVVALASWRARQGLPVVQPVAAVASGARGAPQAPPRAGGAVVAEQEFEDSGLIESYDASDEYVVGVEQAGAPPAIGSAPADGLLPRRGKRDW